MEPEFVLNGDGTLDVPSGPGIGVRVLEERLDKFAVGRKRFKA